MPSRPPSPSHTVHISLSHYLTRSRSRSRCAASVLTGEGGDELAVDVGDGERMARKSWGRGSVPNVTLLGRCPSAEGGRDLGFSFRRALCLVVVRRRGLVVVRRRNGRKERCWNNRRGQKTKTRETRNRVRWGGTQRMTVATRVPRSRPTLESGSQRWLPWRAWGLGWGLWGCLPSVMVEEGCVLRLERSPRPGARGDAPIRGSIICKHSAARRHARCSSLNIVQASRQAACTRSRSGGMVWDRERWGSGVASILERWG